MTNQQIIIAIVVALISTFAKFIFEKILGPYIPERKKLNSYIKKFLRFTFAYVLPAAFIIYLMAEVKEVDRYFVFAMLFNFFAISTHITGYVMTETMNDSLKITEFIINLHTSLSQQSEILADLHKLIKAQNKRILSMEDELKRIKGST